MITHHQQGVVIDCVDSLYCLDFQQVQDKINGVTCLLAYHPIISQSLEKLYGNACFQVVIKVFLMDIGDFFLHEAKEATSRLHCMNSYRSKNCS